jgi:ABC-type dipeptide/oligopeptide/nickel transport system permease component
MTFLLRRVAGSLIQLFCVSVGAFLLFRLLPGDIDSIQLENPQVRRESVEAMRTARGLNQSWPLRYLNWAASSVRGDFGVSLAYEIPVSRLIAPRIRRTLEVALPALVLAWLIGLGAAVCAVRLRVAPIVTPGAAAAAMVPDVVAISLMLWFAVWSGVSIAGAWLPVAGLALAIAPVVFLHASGEFRAAHELEFVRIAQSRGISGARLWIRFVLPASANPLVSLAGISVAAAIGSSFVIEVLTGWPGLGPLFLEAVQARDYPIVQTIVVMLAGVLTLSNLAADLLLYRVDPRIRIPNGQET